MLGSENPEKKRLSPGGSCSTSAIYVGGLQDTEALFQQVDLQADQLTGQLYARQTATGTVLPWSLPVMGSALRSAACCLAERACLCLTLTYAAGQKGWRQDHHGHHDH